MWISIMTRLSLTDCCTSWVHTVYKAALFEQTLHLRDLLGDGCRRCSQRYDAEICGRLVLIVGIVAIVMYWPAIHAGGVARSSNWLSAMTSICCWYIWCDVWGIGDDDDDAMVRYRLFQATTNTLAYLWRKTFAHIQFMILSRHHTNKQVGIEGHAQV